MRATQFVAEFAALTRQEEATLRVIDRAIAEAGLRHRASGKRLPDLELEEGVLFLLAVLANTKPTRAAQAAQQLAEFRCVVGQDRKAASLLARTIGVPFASLSKLKLSDVVAKLCIILADGLFPKDGTITLTIDRGGPAFLNMHLGQHIFLQFTGTTFVDDSSPDLLRETREARERLLRWIGQNTSR
jgi:hypothetical protein